MGGETFEIARCPEHTEGKLFEQLGHISFTVVRNYEALPRNYRVAAPEGMGRHEAEKRLCSIAGCLHDFLGSRDRDVKATDIIREANLRTVIGRPIDSRFEPGAPIPLSGIGSLPYGEVYGRHWGVARQVLQDFGSPRFTNVTPGAYDYTLARNGNGVDLYVLDTGIDVDHLEFDEGEHGTRAQLIWDGFYQVNDDDQNHGTGMASCAAGKTMGVAFHCRVFAAKGLDGNNGGATSALIDGMNSLVARFITEAPTGRPGVMNNSWISSSSSTYTAAVDAAVDAGMVMVASAGNSGFDLGANNAFPAEYDDVLAVGALDLDFIDADFSNYGSAIDVWCAGRDVLQGWRGGTIGWGNGTSPAGAFASGMLCCLLQGYARPADRAAVLAVYDYVRQQVAVTDAMTFSRSNASAAGTTRRVMQLDPRPQPDQPRIAGLNNLLTPWRTGIGGESYCRSVTRILGIWPATTPAAHPANARREIALALAKGSPAAVSADTSRAAVLPWQGRNHGFVDADLATAMNRLVQARDHNANTDGDGDSLEIPGRADANLSFIPSTDAANAEFYQTVPIGMTEDSNPVSLFDVFTNLDLSTGDATGWTTGGSGTADIKSANQSFFPYAGAFMYEGGGGADSFLEQTAALPASLSTVKIDAGKVLLHFEHVMGSSFISDPNDQGRVRLVALAADDTELAVLHGSGIQTALTSGSATWDSPGWFASTDVVLPAGTRKLRLRVDAIFGSGTIVNCPHSGFVGWLYERTSDGDRIRSQVDRGQAQLRFRYVCRSFNIEADDRGRTLFDFFDASGQEIGTALVGPYLSPHKWTEQLHRHAVPETARAVRLAIQGNRRGGAVINFYIRDMTLKVALAARSRPLGSVARSVSKGAQIETHIA